MGLRENAANVRRLQRAALYVTSSAQPSLLNLTASETMVMVLLFDRFKHRAAFEVMEARFRQRLASDRDFDAQADEYRRDVQGMRASDMKVLKLPEAQSALTKLEAGS